MVRIMLQTTSNIQAFFWSLLGMVRGLGLGGGEAWDKGVKKKKKKNYFEPTYKLKRGNIS